MPLAERVDRHPVGKCAPDQGPGRLRQEYLATTPDGAEPGSPHHVDAEVPLAADSRLARVQPHPDADRVPVGPVMGRVESLRLDGRRDGVARPWEREEEGVTLRVDLDATAFAEARAHQSPMRVQDIAVAVAERLQQGGRALDVAEDERDSSTGQSRHGPQYAAGAAAPVSGTPEAHPSHQPHGVPTPDTSRPLQRPGSAGIAGEPAIPTNATPCPLGKNRRATGGPLASLTALGPTPSPASLPSSLEPATTARA